MIFQSKSSRVCGVHWTRKRRAECHGLMGERLLSLSIAGAAWTVHRPPCNGGQTDGPFYMHPKVDRDFHKSLTRSQQYSSINNSRILQNSSLSHSSTLLPAFFNNALIVSLFSMDGIRLKLAAVSLSLLSRLLTLRSNFLLQRWQRGWRKFSPFWLPDHWHYLYLSKDNILKKTNGTILDARTKKERNRKNSAKLNNTAWICFWFIVFTFRI